EGANGDGSVLHNRRTAKGAKNAGVLATLLFLVRHGGGAGEEELGAQQPDAFGSPLTRSLRFGLATNIRQQVNLAISQIQWSLSPARSGLKGGFLLLLDCQPLGDGTADIRRGAQVEKAVISIQPQLVSRLDHVQSEFVQASKSGDA